MSQRNITFSVVIAVYNEGAGLFPLVERINSSLEKYKGKFEMLLVDDRSTDNSWEILTGLAKVHPHLKIARFCRNFGQHSAISAGLKLAKGDFVILMDCDLQDEPENIIPMYKKLLEDNKMIIYAKRQNRQDKSSKVFFSKMFHNVVAWLSGMDIDSSIGTFRIMRKTVVDSFNLLPENRRYVGGLFYWMDFESGTIDVEHKARIHGVSNYNLKKLLSLAKLGILSFSTKLLSFGIYLGLGSSIIALIIALYYLVLKLVYDGVIPGFTAIIISLYFLGGVILIILGIIGEYIGELFKEVKGRPNFIIEETHNIEH